MKILECVLFFTQILWFYYKKEGKSFYNKNQEGILMFDKIFKRGINFW